MKILSVALLLMASIAFVLLGCSDKSAPIVAPIVTPNDQPGQAPASLEKCIITSFTFVHAPIGLTGEGSAVLVPGGKWHRDKWQIKKYGVIEEVNLHIDPIPGVPPFPDPPPAPDPLVSGTMVHYLSATLDAITGEGPVHGTFTLTPVADVRSGVWEGTYEGYRSKKTDEPGAFTLPLKIVGHGRGGTINGMQVREESILTAYGTPPTWWTGVGKGSYKSH